MKKFAIISLIALLTLSSCDSYMTSGALLGGAVGSAIGGIAGGRRGSDIGALVGMATGAAAGAAARESEERRVARSYYVDDDVYVTNDPKAERVRRYHENTAAKYSGGNNGYRSNSSRSSNSNNSGNSSRSRYGMRVNSNGVTVTNTNSQQGNQQNDNSGYNKEGKYDDRIEIK